MIYLLCLITVYILFIAIRLHQIANALERIANKESEDKI